MTVKRYICKLLNGMADAKLFHHPGEQYVLASDYDKLEAQLEEIRLHLGTLAPGGSNTCITCAAHCVSIEDLESDIAQLEAENARLNMEMAAYRQGCTQADAKAMLAVIDALQAEKSARAALTEPQTQVPQTGTDDSGGEKHG